MPVILPMGYAPTELFEFQSSGDLSTDTSVLEYDYIRMMEQPIQQGGGDNRKQKRALAGHNCCGVRTDEATVFV